MMTHPLRARALLDGTLLCVNDSGGFFSSDAGFLERLAHEKPNAADRSFLRAEGHSYFENDALGRAAHLYGVAERLTQAGSLDYLILVPTLRCNLSCSYCQVSRAGLHQPGFDWSEETLKGVFRLLDGLPGDRVKIEFQGGEPTLRPDLIRQVIERCERFKERQFVICTNLQVITPEIWDLFELPNLYISTSLDGDAATHTGHRTETEAATRSFRHNLEAVIARFGPRKISALPTVNPLSPPEPDMLIDSYLEFGFESIFLRPINFQGFARKRHRQSREQSAEWHEYHERFVRRLIARNWADRSRVLEETYLSICLRRIFQPGADRHVDLRNPNPLGADYLVVDHDGTIYPTDEARMLSRSGIIDFSIGDIASGIDAMKRDLLNRHSSNLGDPTCERCAFQPYCGRDVVDDIARYGRIDLERHETEFCRRHLHVFDLIFRLIYEDDPAATYSLSRWLRLDSTPGALGMRHA